MRAQLEQIRAAAATGTAAPGVREQPRQAALPMSHHSKRAERARRLDVYVRCEGPGSQDDKADESEAGLEGRTVALTGLASVAGILATAGSAEVAPVAEAQAATPSGGGYWLVTARGTVYPFGDARFYGDLSHITATSP